MKHNYHKFLLKKEKSNYIYNMKNYVNKLSKKKMMKKKKKY